MPDHTLSTSETFVLCGPCQRELVAVGQVPTFCARCAPARTAGEVFATCGCDHGHGALYVPDVGSMGDESHETIEAAVKSGVRWIYGYDHWWSPTCWEDFNDA